MLGVPPERVFEALQVYLGSAFVNDFNLLGRTYHVTAQADAPFRATRSRHRQPADPLQLGRDGADRLGRDLPGQDRSVSRVALQPLPGGRDRWRYRARLLVRPVAEGDGEARGRNLPPGFTTEWTGIAFQQKAAGSTSGMVFGLAVVFVFLVLAAQFESLMLPLAIILIVPMCLLAAMTGVNLRGHGQQCPDADRPGRADRARGQERDPDRRVRQAGRSSRACRRSRPRSARRADRLRPILMTSFAFILGTCRC